MPGRTLTPRQFAGVLQRLKDEAPGNMRRTLRIAADDLHDEVVKQIHDVGAIATHDLEQSVETTPTQDGARVEVTAPHAAPVEDGSRPHRPPVDPLIQWVLVKGLASTEEDASRIAWAIAAKIEKDGTKPRHYFLRATRRFPAFLRRRAAEQLRELKVSLERG